MQTEGEIETTEAARTDTNLREQPGEQARVDEATGVRPGPADPPAPEASVEAVDHLLDEVEQALGRLDDGTYGQCETCGGPIDDTRLAGEPTVRECAGCESPPTS